MHTIKLSDVKRHDVVQKQLSHWCHEVRCANACYCFAVTNEAGNHTVKCSYFAASESFSRIIGIQQECKHVGSSDRPHNLRFGL